MKKVRDLETNKTEWLPDVTAERLEKEGKVKILMIPENRQKK